MILLSHYVQLVAYFAETSPVVIKQVKGCEALKICTSIIVRCPIHVFLSVAPLESHSRRNVPPPPPLPAQNDF